MHFPGWSSTIMRFSKNLSKIQTKTFQLFLPKTRCWEKECVQFIRNHQRRKSPAQIRAQVPAGGRMCCVCDSGILVVLPILTALLLLALLLLFYDFATPCDREEVNSTVSYLSLTAIYFIFYYLVTKVTNKDITYLHFQESLLASVSEWRKKTAKK